MNAPVKFLSIAAAAGSMILAGCASNEWKVKRVEPTASTDVDYRFNDEDARQIFRSMAKDVLSRPWLDNSWRQYGRAPVVYLATVKNNTQDYINTELFTNQIEDEMINSGRIDLKTPRDLRQELRDERLDTKYNDPATVKAVAKELNSDLALLGSISDVKQRSTSGRTVVNYYQARLQLVDVETQRVVWGDTKEIKKVARR